MKSSSTLDLKSLPIAAREHINQLERIRRDFIANVSHELRTPLTVIQGYLETLLKKSNLDIKPYQKIFSQMYQYSTRMETIIDDLLLLSCLESDDHTPKEKMNVSVAKMLKTLCTDAQRISGEKKHSINLEAEANLCITGSEEELKSLFSNIIINAVKYTLTRGCIYVKWYSSSHYAVFSVSDTGIGISKEHIPRIAERFYRVNKERSYGNGGTGLGLAIVKHVLLRHQGDLHVESELGKGSTFTCRFPY
ncbi:ATP-binding protein [Coxiella endosymbiont of Amblyomma sculptum]|uniref:ATP-binding protein n=1 Tax=Coxiella endosymbiont of Amblyomma sculptum TaxID=2487929 RepID=UPI001FEC2CD4|nr:ATP-binding protein [Coxiella endosymbiont of Amblyomma sculptum]